MALKRLVKRVMISAVPLLFAAGALLGLLRTLSALRFTLEMSRQGVHVMGWVTSKNENDNAISYAYSAGEHVYGGQYRLNQEDSDIYYTKPGDSLNVVYSAQSPYVSMVGDNPEGSLQEEEILIIFCGLIFMASVWLSTIAFRTGKRVYSLQLPPAARPTAEGSR